MNTPKATPFRKILFSFLTLLLFGIFFFPATSQAATLKVKLNGKTTYYRKTQSIVRYQNKTITKSSRKGLTIKGTRMVSYKDVFKKGLKVKTSYRSSKKDLLFHAMELK